MMQSPRRGATPAARSCTKRVNSMGWPCQGLFRDDRGGSCRCRNSDFVREILRLTAKTAANCPQLWASIGSAEARLADRIDTDIRKVIEMGFLRRLHGGEEQFEVRRILKAFIDAQWLGEFDRRLTEYREHFPDSQMEGEQQ